MLEDPYFIPYARQSIDDVDIEAVTQVLKGSVITRGKTVREFEDTVAEYCGAKYAVAFSSGTAALMAACFAAELNSHDRVFSTPNTFVATVGSAYRHNAQPIFVDIDIATGAMDLQLLKSAMQGSFSRGRHVIMPVHFAGIAMDMQLLDRYITTPHSIVIEDAAHALGGRYPDGKKVGSCAFSQMTVFSFHPSKNMTTGEGGMVTTNDSDLYHRLRLFRDNGIERDLSYLNESKKAAPWYYEVHDLTGNYHLTEFAAALGISQLKRLDAFVEKRRSLVKYYRQKLKDSSIVALSDSSDDLSAFHLFVVQIDFQAFKTTRKEVMISMKQQGIGTQVHYIPVYEHPYFKEKMGAISEYFPQMSTYYSQALTLPLFYDMDHRDVDRVCAALMKALGYSIP